MVAPALHTLIDWAGAGFGATPYDTVHPQTDEGEGITLARGESVDHQGAAIGSLEFVLPNEDDAYTPDRNWADDGSFETGTAPWSIAAVSGLLAAATSLTQVTDHATGSGTKAGEFVLPATLHAGGYLPLRWRCVAGHDYAFTVWMKRTAGASTVECGVASLGTPADVALAAGTITGAWVAYSGVFTPAASHEDVGLFIRTTAAAAATVRVDALQFNPGTVPNAYIEAPTRAQLAEGRPVLYYATSAGVDKPRFYGVIERLQHALEVGARKVTITCHDPLQALDGIDVSVSGDLLIARTAREMRLAILEDAARGNRNILPNPSIETDVSNWTANASTFTRVAGDAAPDGGTACGEWVWTSGTAWLTTSTILVPAILAGQYYHASLYLKPVSGSTAPVLQAVDLSTGSVIAQRTLALAAGWNRYPIVIPVQASIQGFYGGIGVRLVATSATTLRVDNAAVTRGKPLYPYEAVGTGRAPNFIGNGSFDWSGLSGWINGWKNLVPNGNFTVDASGWNVTSDSYVAGAASVTRVTTHPKLGAANGKFTHAGAASTGGWVNIGAVVAGEIYDFGGWIRQDSGSNQNTVATLGSNGTTADKAQVSQLLGSGVWSPFAGSWTVPNNRSDVHLSLSLGNGAEDLEVDGLYVSKRDPSASGANTVYSDTGPGGGMVAPASRAISSSQRHDGMRTLAVTTPATARAGMLYDFSHVGPQFAAAQPFTLKIAVFAADAMPYRIGLGAAVKDGSGNYAGSWDENDATGTLTAGAWNELVVTWTPATQVAPLAFASGAWVMQTDATARTFYVGRARVIPAGSADEFELPEWGGLANGAEDDDVFLQGAPVAGTALSALVKVNDVTGSRHRAEPLTTAPYWRYTVEDRDSYAQKTVAKTISEDVDSFGPLDVERSSYVNVVEITWLTGSDVVADEVNVGRFGPRFGDVVEGSAFYATRDSPAAVAEAFIDRYKYGVARPTMEIADGAWAYLDDVALSDLIAVNLELFRLRGSRWIITHIGRTAYAGGAHERATVELESYPY